MGLFSKKPKQEISPVTKYNNARSQILIALIFTLINIALVFINNGSSYFLFSIYVPYFMILLSYSFCGMMPADYYDESFGDFLPKSFLAVVCVIAAVVLIVYLLCYIFSKKHIGWMIAALVLVSIDTVLLLIIEFSAGTLSSSFMDILFHIWLVYYAAAALKYHRDIKKMILTEEVIVPVEEAADERNLPPTDMM